MKASRSFIYLLLIVSIGVTTISSCTDKDAPPKTKVPLTLPPLTHEGVNTAGCRLNGGIWIPKTGGTLWNQKPAVFAYYGPFIPELDTSYHGSLDLRFYRRPQNDTDEVGSTIQVIHTDIRDTGVYRLWHDFSGPTYTEGGVRFGDNKLTNFFTQPSDSNWIHVTFLDLEKRIISGRFQFDVVNEDDPTDTFRIRDGRFDLSFIY